MLQTRQPVAINKGSRSHRHSCEVYLANLRQRIGRASRREAIRRKFLQPYNDFVKDILLRFVACMLKVAAAPHAISPSIRLPMHPSFPPYAHLHTSTPPLTSMNSDKNTRPRR
eukprot:247593-Chlamydomonas_euryale.AAC.5